MNTPMRMSLTLLMLLLAAGLPSLADAPPPDFTNLPGYMTALNQSTDPQAAAIRHEIAAGPTALAYARAKAQAAGIPLTITIPTVPSDQNAAPLFDQWKALQTQQKAYLPGYADSLSNRYAYTPDQIARVQSVFDDNPQVFALLHETALKPVRVYTGEAWPHYAEIREAARELRTQQYLLAYQKRYTDAVAVGALGLNLAKQNASQADFVDYLVDEALENIALSGLRDTLAMAGPNTSVDTQVSQTLQNALPMLSLKTALTHEVAHGISELETVRKGTPQDFAQLVAAPGVPLPPNTVPKTFTPAEHLFVTNLLAATEATYLTRMQTLIAAADQPNRRALFAAMQKEFEDTDNPAIALDPLRTLLQIVSPTEGGLLLIDDKQHADEQVTLAAAAILAAKARTGAFPSALPGNFPDPFSDQPLGYRLQGSGFVVYSVGPDGVFEGDSTGQSQFPARQIFFQYPAATPSLAPVDMLK